ncbi:MAG: serine/threonine-protein kinase [Terriglobales bacterium]
MQPERWRRVEELYHTAVEQGEGQRAAFLESSCAGDHTLRLEVESLIAYARQTGQIIDKPVMQVVASALAEDLCAKDGIQADEMIGSRIAQYRLVGKLGAGGMGDVYRAVRADDQYEKQVAIKLVRQGLNTELVHSRFRKERQILAGFEHENIARLLDGGTTDEGDPYFVMELVEGKPIDEYCDEAKLGVAARLELFQSVCSAVQYAHQRLVVHRDIKPGNILVTAEGLPKLLDFGIATLLSPENYSPEGDPTATAMRMMTPQYASPEQLRGDVITTATDVYSLGVVLYRLLTGQLPYHLDNNSSYDLAHAICETEPEKPSTAVGSPKQIMDRNRHAPRVTPQSISSCRNTSPDKLRRTLSGDLDHILLKALRKEPQRRYASAQDFAKDLRSYALGLPVSARRGTFSYRGGKFVARNKLSLAVTAIFVLLALAGAVTIVREARIARMQQARAEQRFDSLNKLTNSMLFEFHDAIQNLPGSTAARELVVRRALEYLEQIAAEGHNDPATLRNLASAYERIGLIRSEEGHPHLGGVGSFQAAQQLYEKALTIRQRLAAANPGDLSLQFDLNTTMWNVATMYSQLGDEDHALDTHRQRLKLLEGLAKSHDSERVRYNIVGTLNNIAASKITFGDYESALDDLQRAQTMVQALLDADPTNLSKKSDTANGHAWIGSVLKLDKKYVESVREARVAVAMAEELALQDPNNTGFQRAFANYDEELCKSLAYAGQFLDALRSCRKTIAISEALMKSDKNDVQAETDVASGNKTMGIALYLMHSPREAQAFERRAHSMYREVAARDPDSTINPIDEAVALIYLGRSEVDLNRPELARLDLEHAQQMLEQSAKRSPKDRPVLDALDEVQAAIKALPHGTAYIAVH